MNIILAINHVVLDFGVTWFEKLAIAKYFEQINKCPKPEAWELMNKRSSGIDWAQAKKLNKIENKEWHRNG